MSNTTKSCIYPLVDTVHSTFGETSCGISCGNEQDFYIFYTSEEQYRLKTVLIVMSLITICLVLLSFCTALSEKRQRQRSFFKLPFANQCRFFISSGYMLVACITISPYIFGADKIICNQDEKTLTSNSFHNVPCSLTALGLFFGIRLVVFYDTALSISLVLTLYYPMFVQLKRYFHTPILILIGLGVLQIFWESSITGDYHIGFCTTTLASRANSLTLNIIPLGSCSGIFFTCLVMASIKLFRRNMWLVNAFSVNNEIQSLFKRLLIYNLLQTTAVVAVVGNFIYWYANIYTWQETAYSTIMCEMGKTLANQTSLEDYEMCVRENGDLPRPQIWTYFLFLLCILIGLLGAIIFQCSLKVQQTSYSSFRSVVLSFFERLTSITPWRRTRDTDRLQSTDPLSSVTDLNRTATSEMTILESLQTDRSISKLKQLQTSDVKILNYPESQSRFIEMQHPRNSASSNEPFLVATSLKNLDMGKLEDSRPNTFTL